MCTPSLKSRLLNRFSKRKLPYVRSATPSHRPARRLLSEALERRNLMATFAVLNVDDAGAGSLRQAIIDANTNVGPDLIRFDIPGASVHTIAPTSALPVITDPVTIDGYTQVGSSVNTLPDGNNAVINVELSGVNAGNFVTGLTVKGGGTTIRGLAVHSYHGHGIQLGDTDLVTPGGNVLEGNFIGLDATGTTRRGNVFHGVFVTLNTGNRIGTDANGVADPAERNVISSNNFGIVVQYGGAGLTNNNTIAGNFVGTDRTGTIIDPNGTPGDGDDLGNNYGIKVLSSDGNHIGGTTAAARNIVSGNQFNGVDIQGTGHPGATQAEHNVVQGNYIGTDVTGTIARGNGVHGITVESAEFTLVGGNTPGAGNLVSGNGPGIAAPGMAGIILDASISTIVQGNFVGTDVTGNLPLGNTGPVHFLGGNGIKVQGGSGNRVGGTGAGEGNLIRFNAGAGVLVTDNNFSPAVGNSVRGNSISDNVGLGIDITLPLVASTGVTLNDNEDIDVGPNGFQNFPLIATVQSSGSGTTITGSLNSTPLSTFTIDFYATPTADPSGYGEGQLYLGSTTVTTDASGNAVFNATVSGIAPVGQFVSATATSSIGATSEFSGLGTVISVNSSPSTLVINGGTIRENDIFTLVGSFADADLLDTHTVSIQWGEGLTEVHTLPVGARTFTFTHQYLDDNPTSSSSDVFPIVVNLGDNRGGSTSANESVTVQNVAPTDLAWQLSSSDIGENGSVTVTGKFRDQGTLDSHTVTINWGEGLPQSYTLPVGGRTFSISHQYRDDAPTATASDKYSIKLSLSDDDLGQGRSTVFGLKSRNGGAAVGSIQPTHLYQFNSDGTDFVDVGAIKFGATNIDADALAYSPSKGLFAFQIHSVSGSATPPTDSSFIAIDPVTAVPTLISSAFTGRVVRAAAFDAEDRLWVVDSLQNELLQIDTSSGAIIGSPVSVTFNGTPLSLRDLAFSEDGTAYATDATVGAVFYTLNMTTGVLTQVAADMLLQAPAEGTVRPVALGLALVGQNAFTYDAQGTDDIYQYNTGAGFTRSLVFANIIPSYNSGQGDLAIASASRVVTVRNIAPSINSLSASSVDTLGAVNLVGTFSDVGSLDTHKATIDWGDGSSSPAVVAANLTGSHVYALSGTYTITVSLADDDTGATSASTTLTVVIVNNDAPSLSIVALDEGVKGHLSDFRLTATDPNAIDANGPFTFRIDWGDGSPVQVVTIASGRTAVVSHRYLEVVEGGFYSIQADVVDGRGATSLPVSYDFLVTGWSLRNDPLHPGDKALIVVGSQGEDEIRIRKSSRSDYLKLQLRTEECEVRFRSSINTLDIDRVLIYGLDGDDLITSDEDVLLPHLIWAGAGDDRVLGGGGNDVIDGGIGNDRLDGNTGRDLLIGGKGEDRLYGDAGDDILIAGYTTFDGNRSALESIMAEWGNLDRTYTQRRQNLSGISNATFGSRANGNTFFKFDDPVPTNNTVFDDGAADILFGEQGMDWFLLNLDGDHGSRLDQARDRNSSETQNDSDRWF